MKKFTQIGTFTIAATVIFMVVLGAMIFKTGISEKPDSIILCLTWAVFFVCLLFFYKLTITIDNDSISFSFGIGWFGKSYQLSEISSCAVVKNSWLVGIGIRYLGNGWLYNVSGLKAIELTFKNKNSVVRIGTGKPEEICEVFQKFTTDKLSTDH